MGYWDDQFLGQKIRSHSNQLPQYQTDSSQNNSIELSKFDRAVHHPPRRIWTLTCRFHFGMRNHSFAAEDAFGNSTVLVEISFATANI